ncbi:ABC transporter permease subunit [Paraburkholderia sp. 22099]|jgi:sulfonate transport system permease protein|uniref:ABC transporter permease subunit n=1 Tax=Paraburkholderia TaxID=1822464 RepID=UPI0028570128|nr:ABC transporter permease subunit [Paraburkholderia terricola]MDR6494670.1 sulfonate transport system permease protein [Paraburkholderia terricola]
MADLTSIRNRYVALQPSRAGVSKVTLYRWLSWMIPVVVVLLWESAARLELIAPQVLPAPSSVLETAVDMARNGDLFVHLGVSLLRAAGGFVIGGTLGLALGIVVGFSPLAQALLDRSIQMVRAIPFLAMLPLVIVWFGVGEVAKIFLVALAVLFPIYINTMLGIRQIDPKLMELARVIGLERAAIVRRIILPGAMPSILTGVRYALAHAWLALVIAETLATTKGIGFLAMDAREFLNTHVILLTMIIYAIIGVVADALVRLLEARFLSWHANYAKGARK